MPSPPSDNTAKPTHQLPSLMAGVPRPPAVMMDGVFSRPPPVVMDGGFPRSPHIMRDGGFPRLPPMNMNGGFPRPPPVNPFNPLMHRGRFPAPLRNMFNPAMRGEHIKHRFRGPVNQTAESKSASAGNDDSGPQSPPKKPCLRHTVPLKPWITKETLNKINLKNKLYKRLMQTKDPEAKAAADARYKKYRNDLRHEKRKAKIQWLKEHMDEAERYVDRRQLVQLGLLPKEDGDGENDGEDNIDNDSDDDDENEEAADAKVRETEVRDKKKELEKKGKHEDAAKAKANEVEALENKEPEKKRKPLPYNPLLQAFKAGLACKKMRAAEDSVSLDAQNVDGEQNAPPSDAVENEDVQGSPIAEITSNESHPDEMPAHPGEDELEAEQENDASQVNINGEVSNRAVTSKEEQWAKMKPTISLEAHDQLHKAVASVNFKIKQLAEKQQLEQSQALVQYQQRLEATKVARGASLAVKKKMNEKVDSGDEEELLEWREILCGPGVSEKWKHTSRDKIPSLLDKYTYDINVEDKINERKQITTVKQIDGYKPPKKIKTKIEPLTGLVVRATPSPGNSGDEDSNPGSRSPHHRRRDSRSPRRRRSRSRSRDRRRKRSRRSRSRSGSPRKRSDEAAQQLVRTTAYPLSALGATTTAVPTGNQGVLPGIPAQLSTLRSGALPRNVPHSSASDASAPNLQLTVPGHLVRGGSPPVEHGSSDRRHARRNSPSRRRVRSRSRSRDRRRRRLGRRCSRSLSPRHRSRSRNDDAKQPTVQESVSHPATIGLSPIDAALLQSAMPPGFVLPVSESEYKGTQSAISANGGGQQQRLPSGRPGRISSVSSASSENLATKTFSEMTPEELAARAMIDWQEMLQTKPWYTLPLAMLRLKMEDCKNVHGMKSDEFRALAMRWNAMVTEAKSSLQAPPQPSPEPQQLSAWLPAHQQQSQQPAQSHQQPPAPQYPPLHQQLPRSQSQLPGRCQQQLRMPSLQQLSALQSQTALRQPPPRAQLSRSQSPELPPPDDQSALYDDLPAADESTMPAYFLPGPKPAADLTQPPLAATAQPADNNSTLAQPPAVVHPELAQPLSGVTPTLSQPLPAVNPALSQKLSGVTPALSQLPPAVNPALSQLTPVVNRAFSHPLPGVNPPLSQPPPAVNTTLSQPPTTVNWTPSHHPLAVNSTLSQPPPAITLTSQPLPVSDPVLSQPPQVVQPTLAQTPPMVNPALAQPPVLKSQTNVMEPPTLSVYSVPPPASASYAASSQYSVPPPSVVPAHTPQRYLVQVPTVQLPVPAVQSPVPAAQPAAAQRSGPPHSQTKVHQDESDASQEPESTAAATENRVNSTNVASSSTSPAATASPAETAPKPPVKPLAEMTKEEAMELALADFQETKKMKPWYNTELAVHKLKLENCKRTRGTRTLEFRDLAIKWNTLVKEAKEQYNASGGDSAAI